MDVWNGILGDLSGSLERGRAQISRDLVGAIHESPANKLGFIGEFGKRHFAKNHPQTCRDRRPRRSENERVDITKERGATF